MSWIGRLLELFRGRKPIRLDRASDLLIVYPTESLDRSAERPGRPVTPGVFKNPDFNEAVRSRGLSYFVPDSGKRDWVYPQYDHYEVEMVYDIESYAARATRAKLALFLKGGFEFIGREEERVSYVKTRFKQIERASSLPLEILLFQTCRDLLVHSNAYWVKVRSVKASGGKVRSKGNTKINPVAGYFPLPPETMIPELDSGNNIVRWKQLIGSQERIFSTDDIVHFYTNRKGSYPLGVPSIWASIDDIKSLRSIEASIDVLIHKHLFPVFLWKVGTPEVPAQAFPDGRTELEVVKEEVANMPLEGSLVVSERYNVEAIGAENKALRVEAYLQHFVNRLLAGLDVSSIDVGIGSTSTRSTAQTLSRNLMDVVKLHQVVIQRFMDGVIEEILLESTFDPNTLFTEDNLVHLRFHEIDREAKIASENHLMDIFLKNGLTYTELRSGMGREPLSEEEEQELYWNKFGKQEALIRSMDEYSGLGKTPPTSGGGATTSVENKNKPANQHGTREAPKLNKDSYQSSNRTDINPILKWHNSIRDELQARWARDGRIDSAQTETDIRTTYDLATRDMSTILRQLIRETYQDPQTIFGVYRMSDDRCQKYIARLRDDLIQQIKSSTNSPNVIFESLRWRAVLIYDTERAWAKNMAYYRWMKALHVDTAVMADEDACEECKSKLTTIKWDDRLGDTRIPPHHPLCKCWIEAVDRTT